MCLWKLFGAALAICLINNLCLFGIFGEYQFNLPGNWYSCFDVVWWCPPHLVCIVVCPFNLNCAVADPGFPRGGGANRKGGGANLLFYPIFPKTLHENEKNWDWGRVPSAPLGSANAVPKVSTRIRWNRLTCQPSLVTAENWLCTFTMGDGTRDATRSSLHAINVHTVVIDVPTNKTQGYVTRLTVPIQMTVVSSIYTKTGCYTNQPDVRHEYWSQRRQLRFSSFILDLLN